MHVMYEVFSHACAKYVFHQQRRPSDLPVRRLHTLVSKRTGLQGYVQNRRVSHLLHEAKAAPQATAETYL